MLRFLSGRASDRKRRLFACACCRQLTRMLLSDALNALEVAERFADGHAAVEERRVARERAFHVEWIRDDNFRHRRGTAKDCICAALARRALDAARGAASRSRHVIRIEAEFAKKPDTPSDEANLLREVFGNPLRPVAVDPAWLTWRDGTTVKIAERNYEQRAFADLPILADALEEAGCTSVELLGHCRQPGSHVRGCWAVDLILGKT